MLNNKVLILGVGNVLLQDEGVGVHVINRLKIRTWPEHIELVDGGTAGIQMLHFFVGVKKLIIIDCVNADAPPGTIFRFSPGDITVYPKEFKVSFHDIGLVEVLHLARVLGIMPEETVIVGVQPKTVDWGLALTPEITAVIPRLETQVLKEAGLVDADAEQL